MVTDLSSLLLAHKSIMGTSPQLGQIQNIGIEVARILNRKSYNNLREGDAHSTSQSVGQTKET